MARKKEDGDFDKMGILKDLTGIFSKVFKNKTFKFISIATTAFDFLTKRLEKELKKLKKVIIQLSLFAVAVVFLIIGGTMYLERLFPSLSNGLNFITVGAFFLICLFLYSVLTKD